MKKLFLLLQILWATASFAQPTGACATGTTKMGTDGRLYGCVEGSWKKLSELSTATATISTTQGVTQNANGVVYVREMNNDVRDLRNIGFTPIALTGHTHEVGKIIYDATKKHFYQGVANGLWHQIDNEAQLVLKVTVGYDIPCRPNMCNNVGDVEMRTGYSTYTFSPPVALDSPEYIQGYNIAKEAAKNMAVSCESNYPLNNCGFPKCSCDYSGATDWPNEHIFVN